MKVKKVRRKTKINTRKDIFALIYFFGGCIVCYYSFRKILWFCLSGFNEMFYVGDEFNTLNCIWAITRFLLLIGILVIACFAIGEAEEYNSERRRQKKEKRK